MRADLSAGSADQIPQVVAEVGSRQRVGGLRTMDEIVTDSATDSRFDAWRSGILAGLAWSVLKLALSQGITLVAIGLILGLGHRWL